MKKAPSTQMIVSQVCYLALGSSSRMEGGLEDPGHCLQVLKQSSIQSHHRAWVIICIFLPWGFPSVLLFLIEFGLRKYIIAAISIHPIIIIMKLSEPAEKWKYQFSRCIHVDLISVTHLHRLVQVRTGRPGSTRCRCRPPERTSAMTAASSSPCRGWKCIRTDQSFRLP